MNRLVLSAVIVVLVLATAGAVMFFAVPLDVQYLEADVTIEDRAAFKLTNDTFLHFGSIAPDQEATRQIELTNERERPITATVYIDGPRWLSVSENPVRLEPGVTRDVVFTVDPPEDITYGSYGWNITIVYRRR